ncbi:hypothetical protein LTR55_012261, partial [Exophiala xenobiotica]
MNEDAIAFRFGKLQKKLGKKVLIELTSNNTDMDRQNELIDQVLSLNFDQTEVDEAPQLDTLETEISSLVRPISPPPVKRRSMEYILTKLGQENDATKRQRYVAAASDVWRFTQAQVVMLKQLSRFFFEANIDAKTAAARRVHGHFGQGQVVDAMALAIYTAQQELKDSEQALKDEHIAKKKSVAEARKAHRQGPSAERRVAVNDAVDQLEAFYVLHPEYLPKNRRRGDDEEDKEEDVQEPPTKRARLLPPPPPPQGRRR